MDCGVVMVQSQNALACVSKSHLYLFEIIPIPFKLKLMEEFSKVQIQELL